MLSREGPFTLTIPNGGTDSPALSTIQGVTGTGIMNTLTALLRRFAIKAPAALTNACTVQVASSIGGADWVTLQNDSVDFALTAAKENTSDTAGWKDIRIHSAGAEGAARDFLLSVVLEG